jgi:N-acetylated-alpha-linked acidic dipeptidase
MHLGVPSAGIAISSSVPVYHTNFDTFHMYESFLDSSFTYGPTLAGVYGVVATRFAMADILPYDLERYATDITEHIETLSERAEELGRPLDGVLNLNSVLNLNRQVSTALVNEIPEWLNSEQFDADRLREINQKLIQLERSFANPEGLPFSEWQKSVYVATDPWSGYASWMIPGVRYVLEDDQSDELMMREAQKFQIAVSQLTISLGEIYDLIRE